ncbi:hypothetical protein [Anderseniella sp. Alg231-50]|uniref:hypothetical protein n=1 Tax=Anderseniella sp. Alg231-50 TaxID=1922226 RepID=UPI00307B2D1B
MEYLSEIVSFLAGLCGGALITISLTKTKKQVKGKGSLVDQQSAHAEGDIVGGNKTVGNEPNKK